MSEENTNEFAREIDDTVVDQFDDSEDEFDDEESDDADDQESDLVAQSSDIALEAETATAFDSAIAEVSDYLDVVSTDSALA
ncbi:MAG: hypothetical protein NTW81_05435, partial [Actinobacteria bacterium]|nr:hypothetical protein [Actinomycetota bacterium]